MQLKIDIAQTNTEKTWTQHQLITFECDHLTYAFVFEWDH